MKIDMHCHTKYSRDAITHPKNLIKISKKLGIVQALTDHNNCMGWKDVLKYSKELNHDVILGEEIKVYDGEKYIGELLGFFMQEEIPKGQLWDVMDKLKEQDAFISVPHPKDYLRAPGFARGKWLERVLPKIDAIEIFNSRCQIPFFNKLAEAYAKKKGLKFTAGSDAHTPKELGNAYIEIEADSIDEVGEKLKKGKATYYGKHASYKAHWVTQLAKWDLAKDKAEEAENNE